MAFGSDAHLFKMASHAAIGCVSAVASKGKCGPGALSGGVSAFAGPMMNDLNQTQRLVAQAVVGGLASKAGGGDFASGAVTAAFAYMFNEVGLACRATQTHSGVASHCGLFVFNRNGDDPRSAEIRAQFSLGRDQTRFNTDFGTWAADLQTFWSGKDTTQ